MIGCNNMGSSKNRNGNKWGFATTAIHGAFHADPATGAVNPPIYMTSTFAQRSPGVPISDYEYSRTRNPIRDVLEATLAALEKGNYALSFASGCAAFSTLLQSLPKNSHVLMSNDVYGGTLRLIDKVFTSPGLTYSQCDMTDLAEIKSNLQQHKSVSLIWVETPSNPLLQIIDIQKTAELKNQLCPSALLGVDNTFATPYLQNPLLMGADIVCHSTTKYIGGHSDLIGGALILNNKDLYDNLAFLQNAIGAIPSPMDCYFLIRSLKTLAIRMEKHCNNALSIAEFLTTQPEIDSVIYPGLPTHPQYQLAKQQMSHFGGMISLTIKGSQTRAISFLQQLKLFTLAESLGGVESLIEHPALMTHAAIPSVHRQKIGITDGFIRISVGIEDKKDLLADLQQALKNS